MMDKIPHDEFVERLSQLIAFLKSSGESKHVELINKLLQDNMNLNERIDTYEQERNSEEGS